MTSRPSDIEGGNRTTAVEGLYAALAEDGFLPVRDRDQIWPEERISAFRRLTRADLVVAVNPAAADGRGRRI